MLITPKYLQEQKILHNDPEYGTVSSKWAYLVAGIATVEGYKFVLDYGCGKGSLRKAIYKADVDFSIMEYDPAIPGKDEVPKLSFHFVVCTDVLEHIEPECLDYTIKLLADLTIYKLFVVISTKFDKNRWLTDGRNSHQIVEGGSWWMGKFSPYFELEREWNTGVKEWVALLRRK